MSHLGLFCLLREISLKNEINIKSHLMSSKMIIIGISIRQKWVNSIYRWKELQGQLSGYKQKLSAALEIHSFNRDVDDVDDRINEKSVLLSSEDLGKDLPAVQALQRKQEEIERDMTALQNQLEVS